MTVSAPDSSPADLRVDAIDWTSWQPRERAVLCFILERDQVLLIEKKRGLGAGKVNAPGGRIEPGETPLQAAVRETREEVGLTPLDPQEAGNLHFVFADGHSIHCTVFVARAHRGQPMETPEALPFWHPLEGLPYARMWADDIHWLPELLAGRFFRGYFTFDSDRMLDHRVEVGR